MAKRSERKKTVVAFAVLGLGLAVAVPRIIPFGSDTVVIEDGVLFPEDEEPEMAAPTSARPSDGGPKVDLLAAFGSWPADVPVRRAFGEPDELPVASVAAAPEPDAPRVAPPRHLVSMVLLARPQSRAVVDTSIVRVGDEIEAGTVVEITAAGIVVAGPQGRLDYDLGVAGARGFEDLAAEAGIANGAEDDAWLEDGGPFGAAAGGRGPGRDADLADFDAELLQALEAGILGVEDRGELPQGDG